MILKRRVALGGVQLDSLDSRILITGIDEAAGKETISAVSTGAGNGQRITGRRRDTLDVTVKFALKIRNDDMAARSTLLDTVNRWACNGGTLTVGHRSGKQLKVVLAQAPGGGDQYSWSNEFTMIFRAYGLPVWEDATATTKTLTQDDEGTDTIAMPGSTYTNADVTVQSKCGSGNSTDAVSVTINGTTMSFTGLDMSNNTYLVIDHVLSGGIYVLRARVGTTSVLGKKTGDDEFILKPGNNTISYTADSDVIVTVSAKGRYL